ncbi:MAG: prolipoprotein diacylglyceryl transferase [Eubacterium sp.]|nr:prolipoprotein diacylglyceryl transferase [Eubacterium sp.]
MLNEIQLGPVTIHMYGLMIGLGYVTAYLISCLRARKKGLNEDILWGILICSILGILTGSRILYYIVSIPQILKDPSILWNFKNGYVVYGGISFGVLFGYLYCQKKKASFFKYFDLVMPAVSVAQGFGRIGCFFAGCCYGRQTASWFHIIYTHSDFAPNNVPLIPTQLLSSAGNFLIAGFLFWYASKAKTTGTVGAMYMILYSVGRFFIEILRNDFRGEWGGLSTSQLISVIVLFLGILLFILLKKRKPVVASTKG